MARAFSPYDFVWTTTTWAVGPGWDSDGPLALNSSRHVWTTTWAVGPELSSLVVGPFSERQRRVSIPAWGNAPGNESKNTSRANGPSYPSKGHRPLHPIAMPQSLSLVIVHVIFSTKERRPFLGPVTRPKLHAYLATVARNAGCEAYRVGGVADHVHLAIRLSRTITIANLVETLKTSSSKWVKTEEPNLAAFSWQHGYGCFSVGPADSDSLRAYIDTQEEHHKTRTFQDEFRMFLKKYGVEYEEAYVWD